MCKEATFSVDVAVQSAIALYLLILFLSLLLYCAGTAGGLNWGDENIYEDNTRDDADDDDISNNAVMNPLNEEG